MDRYAVTSGEFVSRLLQKGRVMSLPGTAFGSMGEGYVRLCFANSDENILEGIRRIRKFVTEEFPVK